MSILMWVGVVLLAIFLVVLLLSILGFPEDGSF